MFRCRTNNIELDFKIDPPSDYYKKILGNSSVATVCIDRWYLDDNLALAYSYTIIPIEVISKFNIIYQIKIIYWNSLKKNLIKNAQR